MRQAHALGRAPVIYDGDVVLAESGAIVEYILARYGQGVRRACGTEGSLVLQILREWSVDRMLPDGGSHPGRRSSGTARARTHLAMIEDAVRESAYLAGDAFTAADIMMASPFTTFRRHVRPLDLGLYPAIAAYLARLETRPGFR